MKTPLRWLVLAAALMVPASAAEQRAETNPRAVKSQANTAQRILVYRTASCGCCGKWVDHLKAAGFEPTVRMVERIDQAPPQKDVPAELRSCHTATLEGYTVEGHVPADVIRKLLQERPRVAGIAVPGMPAGSPGMESPNPQPYQVLTFDANGKTSVYARR